KESPSLQMQIYAYVAAAVAGVVNWWDSIVGGAGAVVHALPLIADQTTAPVGAVRQITDTAGLSLPTKLLLVMAVSLALAATWRVIRERVNNGGKAGSHAQ